MCPNAREGQGELWVLLGLIEVELCLSTRAGSGELRVGQQLRQVLLHR